MIKSTDRTKLNKGVFCLDATFDKFKSIMNNSTRIPFEIREAVERALLLKCNNLLMLHQLTLKDQERLQLVMENREMALRF